MSTTDTLRTSPALADFDGNGQAEVIYGDQEYLRIYDGPTGEVLFETCNTTGTLYEYPLVADVDNDGHADIVAIAAGAWAWDWSPCSAVASPPNSKSPSDRH